MMKSKVTTLAIIIFIFLGSCKSGHNAPETNIIFLHHSTGAIIWKGAITSPITKAIRRISASYAEKVDAREHLPWLFDKYNRKYSTNYLIKEQPFPKAEPYGWNNDPYDYFNIWVKNEGPSPFMNEPTLEILTKDFDVIIFKHCFPVSNIQADKDTADLYSDIKTIANYKLQYLALREKMHQFPDTKFILFTGAAQVKSNISEEEAKRAREFFAWVISSWDIPEDNIFIWDLYNLETEGGLYLKEEFAVSSEDSHPNYYFAGRAYKLLFNRIIDVIDNNGITTKLTGEKS